MKSEKRIKINSAIKESGFKITEVVSGGCRGVDWLGECFAHEHKEYHVPIKLFNANWTLGHGAGPIRNKQMAEYADALIAIWDGKSRGTKNMIDEAKAKGLKVFVKVIE